MRRYALVIVEKALHAITKLMCVGCTRPDILGERRPKMNNDITIGSILDTIGYLIRSIFYICRDIFIMAVITVVFLTVIGIEMSGSYQLIIYVLSAWAITAIWIFIIILLMEVYEHTYKIIIIKRERMNQI